MPRWHDSKLTGTRASVESSLRHASLAGSRGILVAKPLEDGFDALTRLFDLREQHAAAGAALLEQIDGVLLAACALVLQGPHVPSDTEKRGEPRCRDSQADPMHHARPAPCDVEVSQCRRDNAIGKLRRRLLCGTQNLRAWLQHSPSH